MDTQDGLWTDVEQPATPGKDDMEAALTRSAVQIAAGETVPLVPVLMRLQKSADDIRRSHTAAAQLSREV